VAVAPPAQALCLPAPWFVEPATGMMGPVALDLPQAMVTRLLHAPPVPVEYVEQVRAELSRRVPGMALPAPKVPALAEDVRGPMRPRLRLFVLRLEMPEWVRGGLASMVMPRARLAFTYDGLALEAHDRRTAIVRNGRVFRVRRDAGAETAAMQRLKDLGFVRADAVITPWGDETEPGELTLATERDWLEVMLHEVPKLRQDGWLIELADDFPYNILEVQGDWTAELSESSGIDWLELHLGVMVDGQRIDLVPALLRIIASAGQADTDLPGMLDRPDGDSPFLVPIDDGRLLSVPLGRVRPILLALWELFSGGGLNPAQGARFTRLDAIGIAALEDIAGIV
jgi:hypothetical protein